MINSTQSELLEQAPLNANKNKSLPTTAGLKMVRKIVLSLMSTLYARPCPVTLITFRRKTSRNSAVRTRVTLRMLKTQLKTLRRGSTVKLIKHLVTF